MKIRAERERVFSPMPVLSNPSVWGTMIFALANAGIMGSHLSTLLLVVFGYVVTVSDQTCCLP